MKFEKIAAFFGVLVAIVGLGAYARNRADWILASQARIDAVEAAGIGLACAIGAVLVFVVYINQFLPEGMKLFGRRKNKQ